MKILLFADLHLDPATEDNTRPACDAILAAARREDCDLIVNAGDLSWKRGHLAPWVSRELRKLHVELADLAPVVVVAGNHDLSSGGIGTVLGALDLSAANHLHLYERPGIVEVAGLHVACLPYPSRSWLLAGHPDIPAADVNAVLSAALADIVRGLAAQIPSGAPAVLVFHGSLAGARSDSEQEMSTEIDIVLEEPAVPDCFGAILCGHIHRGQLLGRAVYPGSPAPLTFAEEHGQHGYAVLEGGPWTVRLESLAPAHRLITIDARGREPHEWVNDGSDGRYQGARIRVLLTVRPGDSPGAMRAHWTNFYLAAGAHAVKVQIERAERERVELPEVRHEAAIGALVEMWAAREEVGDLLADVQTVAAECEAQLPADVRLRAQAAGYRLLRLECDDFKVYGHGFVLDVDALPSLTVIEAGTEKNNASGKSTAAELECFALYGVTPRGRVALGDLVRQGSGGEARVAAEIESGGERWRIVRRVKLNGRGIGSADLQLLRRASGAWVPGGRDTARETQALIESLVGPLDLYLTTRYASQGDITRPLDLSPAALKEVLQQAIGAEVYERREEVARTAQACAQRAVEEHESRVAIWKAEAGMLSEREGAARDREAALACAREAAERSGAAAVEAEKAASRAQAAVDGIAAAVAEWDESRRRADLAAERIRAVTMARNSERSALARAVDAAAEVLAKLPDAEALLAEHRVAREAMKSRQVALDAARTTLEHARRSRVGAVELRAARLRELDTIAERAADALAIADTRLREHEGRAGLIEQVPFKGRCAEARCPLLADAIASRELLPLLHGDLAAASEAVTEARRSRAQAGDHPGAELDALAQAVGAAESAVQDAEQALATARVDEVEVARINAEVIRLRSLKPHADRRDALRLAVEELGRQLEAAMRDAKEAAACHEARGARPEIEAHEARSREAVRALEAAAEERDRARQHAWDAQQAVADARALVEQSRAAEVRVAEHAPLADRLARRAAATGAYLRAVGRDGIPYLVLERALPTIEQLANHFLCGDLDSGLALEIGAFRELQSGGERAEVAIRFSGATGTHPVANASGMERTAIGYALRAALAELQAQVSGVSIDHWIADEGWGVFDETNIVRIAQPMLRRIAERFGRVLVITHQAPIREVCEARYVVTADAERGSRIERGA